MLLALSTSAPAQEQHDSSIKRKYEIGTLPFSYQINDRFLYKNSYWQPTASAYISSYRNGSNFSWVAQLEYTQRNTDDACAACTDMGDSDFNYKALNATLAARHTWGQKANKRWQPFVQPGTFLGGNRFSGYRFGGWGTDNYNYKAFAYGLDMSVGIKIMISPKLPFTLTSKLLTGWELRNNNSGNIATTTTVIPLQAGLGYIF